MVGKLIGWIVGILIVIWIVSNPTGAGNDVHGWINDVTAFFGHLANGHSG